MMKTMVKYIAGNRAAGLKRLLVMAILAIGLGAANLAVAEPWIDSRDSGLRLDIERLSQSGIIKVPINTWPLMWSAVLNDLEGTDLKTVPDNLRDSFARVSQAGWSASKINRPSQSIRLSSAGESQLIRHFGDKAREENEITLRRNSMTEHFAYNLEVTKTFNPWDGEQTHLDNSYFGMVLGNWVGLVGSIERWWGPSWNSSIILSNNARPTTGLTLQRNYSDPFEFALLSWMGPWTTSMFITELDDERTIKNAKLVGMSVGFRPTQRLEINLRRTAQWGGKGRPQTLKSFVELLTGIADNCDDSACKATEPGNQLAGIDLRWDIPWLDASFYGQTIGEDESGGVPIKRARQVGMQFNLDSDWFDGLVFVEYDDTSLQTATNRYNSLYNHSIYRTGYRYEGRVIGATWDNDSTVTSLGAIGYLNNGDRIEARYSFGEINRDNLEEGTRVSRHSVNRGGAKLNTVAAKWQRPFEWGELEVEGRYTDQIIDEFGRQQDKLRLAASVNYYFY